VSDWLLALLPSTRVSDGSRLRTSDANALVLETTKQMMKIVQVLLRVMQLVRLRLHLLCRAICPQAFK